MTLLRRQPYIQTRARDSWPLLRKWLSAETFTTPFAAMIVGVGHDVFEVARMEAELRTQGTHLRDALFTPEEVAYCEAKRYPARHFAVRFAAKEAFFKALGTDPAHGQPWREVEVRNEANGQPRIHLHGATSELAHGRRIANVLLSLSHTAELAAATVVLEARGSGSVTGER